MGILSSNDVAAHEAAKIEMKVREDAAYEVEQQLKRAMEVKRDAELTAAREAVVEKLIAILKEIFRRGKEPVAELQVWQDNLHFGPVGVQFRHLYDVASLGCEEALFPLNQILAKQDPDFVIRFKINTKDVIDPKGGPEGAEFVAVTLIIQPREPRV